MPNFFCSDVSVRRVNDALTGITRSCILPQGVPMIDPNDPTKVIRNINNRSVLHAHGKVLSV